MRPRKLPSGRWQGVYRDHAGARHTATFDRHADAVAWTSEHTAKLRRGTWVDPKASGIPLGEFVEATWWPNRVAEQTTLATDRGRLDLHLLPEWEAVAIDRVTPTAVQGWVKRLSKSGLAAATVRACHQLLRSILLSALRDGLIERNPCEHTVLPAVPPGCEVYLTREEIDQVGDEIDNPLHWTAFYTLYLTGMRWGEVAGLHADRLHPLRKRLDVVDVLVEVGGRREIKPYPKSKARRTLPLTDELCELLAEHLARYPARGRQLVFQPQPVGMLSRHTWGRDVFRPAVARALGRTDVRVHDLRHSYASALVQAGRPLQEVQLLLGHASITTTQRYAHLGPDRFEDAVAVLERPRRAPNVRHQGS